MIKHDLYSYRNDPDVPEFDDGHPVLVFDGVCVLCSGSVKFLTRWDKANQFRFATAQSKLGGALLRHYGCDDVSFDTVLLVHEGRGRTKSGAYVRIAKILGGLWHVMRVFWLVPYPIRDFVYDVKARNRYNWFGKAEYCTLLPDHIKDRIIDQ